MKTNIALLALGSALAPGAQAFIAPSPRYMAKSTAQRPAALFQQRTDPLSILPPTPERKPSTDPTPVLISAWKKHLNDAKMPAVAALVAVALLAMSPLPSDAAMSGGRMGGSFSSSPSRMVSPSRSSSSSFRSGYSSGYRSGYYSRPSPVIVAPIVTPGYGYGYGYGGYGYGYSAPGVVSYSSGSSGLFSFLLFGGLAFAAINTLSGLASRGASEAFADSPFSTSVSSSSALGPGRSVVQLSVALDVSNRDEPNSILGALDRLSRTARTDSRVGIQNLTSQVALEILRRRSSIVSAWTSTQHFRDYTKAQREFQSRSVRERSKFETESVSNYGGVDYGTSSTMLSGSNNNQPKATMAVITLVLSIDGDQTKLPTINGISDVEAALRKIASDVKVEDCLQSAEILWTPEDRSETLSMRDVVADYPELRSV